MDEGRARYSAAKAAAKAESNPVSEAARTLAQARNARQAQAAEPPKEEEPQQTTAEDDPQAPAGETLDDTATHEQPTETEATTEEEPAEAQTIDLGDGVKVTLDEVRDGFMLKADHTRKTQKLADDRKSFEDNRTQRLSELDAVTNYITQLIPKPKPQSEYVEELGYVEGIKAFERQNAFLSGVGNAQKELETQRTRTRQDAEAARDTHLAENYNKEWADPQKRDKAYADLSSYALRLGAKPQELQGMTSPWMIQAIDKAAKYDAIEASKGKITKAVAAKPKVIKPGAKVSAQAAQGGAVQQAHARLKSSGNPADAVAYLRLVRAQQKRG